MKLRTRSASCQMSSYCCWVIGMTICLAPRGTCVEGVFRSRSTCRVFGRASILASPSLERSRMTKMPPDGYPAFLQYLQSGRPGRPGWLPTQVSGKEVTSPPPPPLRTARESFPSCSSSLSNALRRTRLSHIYLLAVDLLMAVRMHQHAVLDRILAPMGSPHDMVVVPPRHRGDLLVANRTDTALLLPEQPQSPSARQGPGHLHAETFLEVRFPGGVVGIRFPFDLGMSLDRHT